MTSTPSDPERAVPLRPGYTVGRAPVDATDEELDAWAEEFIDRRRRPQRIAR